MKSGLYILGVLCVFHCAFGVERELDLALSPAPTILPQLKMAPPKDKEEAKNKNTVTPTPLPMFFGPNGFETPVSRFNSDYRRN